MASNRAKAPKRIWVQELAGGGHLVWTHVSPKFSDAYEYRLVTPPKKRAGGRRK